MAGLPLNTFRTVHNIVQSYSIFAAPPPANCLVYTVPQGITSILILCQVANVDYVDSSPSNIHDVTMWHVQDPSNQSNQTLYPYNPLLITIVQNYMVPPNDSANLIPGRLVMQTNDQLYVGSTTTSQYLQFTASIIETANQ